MKAVEIAHAEFGAVTSRQDGSVSFRIITPELRASEAGALVGLHGKAVSIAIVPRDGVPEERVNVDAEMERKTPGQRLRSVLFVWWTQSGRRGDFETFYRDEMEKLIEHVKGALKP